MFQYPTLRSLPILVIAAIDPHSRTVTDTFALETIQPLSWDLRQFDPFLAIASIFLTVGADD